MKFYVAENYDAMSRKAADTISAQIVLKPNCVLGLPTGSTPIGTYKVLIERFENGDLDFSQVRSINLDEYAGLGSDHEQSYRQFMQTHLFDHVNIKRENTHVPDGLAVNPESECVRYNEIIRTLEPMDLQVLGVGHNGHIGFNEPNDHFPLGTHFVSLSQTTIEANARFFAHENEVPRGAFTVGIHSIMQAKKVLVLVSGADKAEIVRKAFAGPVTPRVPVSILQLHNDVTVVGDKAAMRLLMETGVSVCDWSQPVT